MINVSNVSLQFPDKKLFENVNINFTPGNCYGVIGANGAGKSTFLKILAGEIAPTTGNVSMDPNERLAVLSQNHYGFEEHSLIETVMMGHKELYEIKKEKDAIYMKADFSDEDGVRAGELEGLFSEMGGWEAESEASNMLQGLGIPTDMHNNKMSDLIEADKIKVLLAQALFGKPDNLLLDEPTNGLDAQAIEWLSDFIMNFPNTVIVVSHDRHFLNTVCTHMADVDFGKIKIYVGNYDFWLQSSQLAAKLAADQNAKKEEQIKELQSFIARFSANASKSKQATSRKKLLDKITLDDIQPSSRRYPFVGFSPEREIGNDLLSVNNLSKSIDGEVLFNNITFTLNRTDKVAFVSKNDNAITALFEILMGNSAADSGTFEWGVTTSQTYLPRNSADEFEGVELPIVDWLRQYASKEESDNTFLRSFLGRMLFTGDDVMKPVNVLSGGEKVRCLLSKMMLSKANVLVMDQPTNHLDLESITALNDGLVKFKSAILIASHDYEVLNTTVNRVIEITPTGAFDRINSTYEEFVNDKELQARINEMYPQD
ncbi:ABC-F family ATP-binding cassette domain-containing protein [Facklamia lactis]|uniref:ABC-F family ATP-binding cassette domain-containing protein n=1 Tax=Facklamia lactis TaxID=2749967 RepID=UPI0018CFCDFD|nr:ATP-binding cassette domain-containing protein [Facklamia lactis]MBG9980597.1 ATP-binding cassette domain-containing protein [Facklamia lactis]